MPDILLLCPVRRHALFVLGSDLGSRLASFHQRQEAEAAERGSPAMVQTCRAIVAAVIGLGVEEEDRKRTWMADAEEAQRRSSVDTARAILRHARTLFPGKKSIWKCASC